MNKETQQTMFLAALLVFIIAASSHENPLSSLADSFSQSSYAPLSEYSGGGTLYNGESITGDFKIKIKKPGFVKQVQKEIGRVDDNAKKAAEAVQAEAARAAERAKAEAMREVKDAGKVGQSGIDELKNEYNQVGAEARRVGDRVEAEVKREAEDAGKVGQSAINEVKREAGQVGAEIGREFKDATTLAKKADDVLYGGLGEKAVAESERFGNRVRNELGRVDENLKKQADELKKVYDPSALKEMFCK